MAINANIAALAPGMQGIDLRFVRQTIRKLISLIGGLPRQRDSGAQSKKSAGGQYYGDATEGGSKRLDLGARCNL